MSEHIDKPKPHDYEYAKEFETVIIMHGDRENDSTDVTIECNGSSAIEIFTGTCMYLDHLKEDKPEIFSEVLTYLRENNE